jgi:hypothetical protein
VKLSGRLRRRAVSGALLGTVLLAAAGCGSSALERAHARGQLSIWLTGYSWQDNTPPGSAIVSHPVLHREAGGTGTFADPITVAVSGHDATMAWPAGTRFYLPSVKRYVIVEDSGASKAPSGTDGHLDMWIDGQGGTKSDTDDCMDHLTSEHAPAVINPPAGLPVLAGPIYAHNTCNVPPDADS